MFTEIEAQFLLEKGLVEVIQKPNLLTGPSKETKAQFQLEYERQADEMRSFENERSMTVFKENVQEIFEGQSKSSARKQKKNQEFKMKSIEELIKDHEEKLANAPLRNRLVHIPTSHPFDVGQTVSKDVTAKDEFKYRVYKDLWERGETITCGETFSGDFLCYPGDPLHYHASQIVTIVDKDKEMTESEMIVHGRTSVSVKKDCLFAQEGEDGAIKYRRLKWVNPETNEVDENS